MKTTSKHLLSILSFPIVGISATACAPTLLNSAQVALNDDVVQVECSSTVGHAFDMQGEAQAIVGQDYRCRFVSTTYELVEGMPPFPIHNELRPSDIEIICGGVNIINQCQLQHNVLIIPGDKIVKNQNITINILGAEIAEWITWEEISHISDLDVLDDEKDLAKDYFQVGDYKKVYKDNKPVSTAILLDFYADEYSYSDGEVIKTKPAPFTFEMQTSFERREWGGGEMEDEDIYIVPAWEQPQCPLYTESERKNNEDDFGLLTRPIDFNVENIYYSHFFPLTLEDYTGTNKPDHLGSAGTIDINLGTMDNAKYAYYKPSQYNTIQTFYDKISKRNLSDMIYLRDIGATSAGTGTFYSVNFRLQKDGKKCDYESMSDGEKYNICWAFCL